MAFSTVETQTLDGDIQHGYNFTWKIENFSDVCKTISTSEISLEPMCSSVWKVILLFDDDNMTGDPPLKLGLKRMDLSAHIVSVNSSFTSRNSKGTPFVRRTLETSFSWSQESKFCSKPFAKPTNLVGVPGDLGIRFRLCKDDLLTIDGTITTISCCQRNEPRNVGHLQNDLKALFKENIFTDVKLVIGQEFLPAHRFILSARSSVFRKMFENDMKENAEKTVHITDIEKPVMEAFLTFIYSGVLEETDTPMVQELYAVADKYDVQSLRQTCHHILSLDIGEDTVCSIVHLADTHNDMKLLDLAMKYLCDNFDSVEPTVEWENFVKCNTMLAAKVVCRIASSVRGR